MSAHHIIIQTERRTPQQTPLGEDRSRLAHDIGGQLHSMGAYPSDPQDGQFVMVVEWDLKTPFVIQHKGDYSARTMGYAGWPDLTKEKFDALPADPV